MKRILFIATGGTIACAPTESGLAPQLSPDALLDFVPNIRSRCEVMTISPMQIDSTDMQPKDWLTLANCIEDNYVGYDGFVIAHGTDTMAYTAGALSYLIQNISKPIVLTGAQHSISLQETDARLNLAQAFTYALDDQAHGISIVFDGKAIAGPRARKTRTKSRNAFQSVDYPAMAQISDGGIIRYIHEEKPTGAPVFYRTLDPKVAVVKLVPGTDAGMIDYLRDRNSALVIESFGMGGLPATGGDAFLSAVSRWQHENKPVVITTQVPYEGCDMSLYEVGQRVKAQYGVMEGLNMTLEAVVTKLMWILGQTKDMVTIRQLFYAPVAHDLLVMEHQDD